MGIEAATTSSMAVTNTNPNSASSNVSSKTNSDVSFKDEMTKVSKSEEKSENKEVKNTKDTKSETSKEKLSSSSAKTEEKKTSKTTSNNDNQNATLNAQVAFSNQLTMNDANMMLTNDIQQMMDSTSLSSINGRSWFIGLEGDSKNSLQMNESDAQFFLNLTQGNDVSMQSIEAQGQGMINAGANASEIAQNVRVSQTLLTALQNSRQNNQPVRIDFDQNISVILRVGRDGAISAQFIPSDKVAEQYLRNNINELRSAFDEQELPYTELSYSNSSKEQNQRRREEQRQGE